MTKKIIITMLTIIMIGTAFISDNAEAMTYDPYDVYSYKSAKDFADDKYEEFYDFEDDYEDEDEAYDAAEEYWYAHQ